MSNGQTVYGKTRITHRASRFERVIGNHRADIIMAQGENPKRRRIHEVHLISSTQK
jgi:hypothetical protein